MGKKKNGPIIKQGLDEWMATYSDLVTLLFCFFVLLYAQSSPDKAKVQYIFQAFSNGGEYVNLLVADEDPSTKTAGEGNDDIPPSQDGKESGSAGTGTGDEENTFEDLYNWIEKSVSESAMSADIDVEGSASQIRIKFNNDVLFDADSYTLKKGGQDALKLITPSINALQDAIKSVEVQGHTADINDYSQMSAVNDWDLSSLRASAVIKYMEFTKTLPGEKFKLEGFAQYTPLVPNDTNEGRAENRRVELIIKKKTDVATSELFEDIMLYDYNQQLQAIDSNGNPIDSGVMNTLDVASGIIQDLKNKYGQTDVEEEDDTTSGPGIGDDMINIPDELFMELDEEGNPIAPVATEATEDSGDAALETEEENTEE